jgi:hypothetical protein
MNEMAKWRRLINVGFIRLTRSVAPINVDQRQVIFLGRAAEGERKLKPVAGTDGAVGLHDVIVPDFVVQRAGRLNWGRHGDIWEKSV